MNFTSKISYIWNLPPFHHSSNLNVIRIQDLLHLKVYAFLFLGIEEMPSNGYMKILGINRYDDQISLVTVSWTQLLSPQRLPDQRFPSDLHNRLSILLLYVHKAVRRQQLSLTCPPLPPPPALTRKFSFPRLIVSCFLVMAVGEREMIRQMKAVYHSASILSNLPLPHGLSLSLGRGQERNQDADGRNR